MSAAYIKVLLFVLFDSLRPGQQFFSYVGTDLPVLNQYEQSDLCLHCLPIFLC